MTVQRLIDVYAQEAGESFERISSLLLDLEGQSVSEERRVALVQEALHLLHGLKGGAMVVEGLDDVAMLLHAMEDYLNRFPRAGSAIPDLDPLFSCIDGARDLIGAAVLEQPLYVDIGGLLTALSRVPDERIPTTLVEPEAAEHIPATLVEPEESERIPATRPSPKRPEIPPIPCPSPETTEGPPTMAPDEAPAANAEEPHLPQELVVSDSRHAGAVATSNDSVRVSVAELDTLVRGLGELTTFRSIFAQRIEEVETIASLLTDSLRGSDSTVSAEVLNPLVSRLQRFERGLRRDAHTLARVGRAAQDSAARLRKLPFSSLFDSLRRATRDLMRRTGKSAQLALEGGDVQIDKAALDELKAPLLHLVRNCLDHGIETPEERRAQDKPEQALLRLSALRRGDRVVIEVEDDGRGLDLDRLRARAEALDVPHAGELSPLDLLAYPGLSTKRVTTEVSGRGLGVGSVREAVERLGGRLSVRTHANRGTTFVMSLPPALGTRRGLLVEAGQQTFALPAQSVQRILRIAPQALLAVDGNPAIELDGVPIPVLLLRDILGLREARKPAHCSQRRFLIVLDAGAERVALDVERIDRQVEMVIQPLGYPIARVPLLEGVAVLSDGVGVPVLDVGSLFTRRVATASQYADDRAPQRSPRVLIVDDSITTRTLERNVLEGAGLEVLVASDGLEALGLVAAEAGDIDLVVSDVDMPELDGLGLVRELRKSYAKEYLPIVLVTSLDQDAVRIEGMAAGANAFILKQTFDPEQLLSVVQALLPEHEGASDDRF